MTDRLIVFSRYPTPGATKTRLIPAIGALAAANLQRYMTEATLATARRAARAVGASLEVHYDGGSERKMRRWLGGGVRYRRQGAGDLGARMSRAFGEAFADGAGRVVLIGSDCPSITEQDLHEAFAALAGHDVAIGPSTDGGYWLIGLSRTAEVFRSVRWGGEEVMADTLALVEEQGLLVRMLGARSDIDTPEDLPALPPGARDLIGRPFLSVIIPALNEAEHIAAAIDSAAGEAVEIIVADGGSSDQTALLAAQAGAKVIASPTGRARQMNAGAEAAASEVLLFLHADTILPDGYAALIFDALVDRRVAGGAFEYATDMNTPLTAIFRRIANFRARRLHLPYGDQGIFVRRSAFEALGGFPDARIAEDLLFVRRLKRHGRILLLPAAAITSGRRWRRVGVLRATTVNQIVLAGCLVGVPPDILAAIHRRLS